MELGLVEWTLRARAFSALDVDAIIFAYLNPGIHYLDVGVRYKIISSLGASLKTLIVVNCVKLASEQV